METKPLSICCKAITHRFDLPNAPTICLKCGKNQDRLSTLGDYMHADKRLFPQPTLSQCCGKPKVENYSDEGTACYLCQSCLKEFIPTVNPNEINSKLTAELFENIEQLKHKEITLKDVEDLDFTETMDYVLSKEECEHGMYTKECVVCTLQPSSDWIEDFRVKFHRYAMEDNRDVLVEELSGKIEDFIQSQIEAETKRCLAAHSSQIPFLIEQGRKEGIERMKEHIQSTRKRFMCGACSGAKCEHTLWCFAFSELLNKLKEHE